MHVISLFSAALICKCLILLFLCLSQGHPARKSEVGSLSLAAQFLFCQQPLLISGLFLHCVVVYYLVFTASAPHPSACSPALHPLLCAVVGRWPRLTHTPYQPLTFFVCLDSMSDFSKADIHSCPL